MEVRRCVFRNRGWRAFDMNRIEENGGERVEVPFGPIPDTPPDEAWRAKVTRFRGGGFEVSAGFVDRQRARSRWERTQGFGVPCRKRARGDELDPDSVRRARQRAQTRVRHLAKNLGVSHLLTLSTRQRANTREEMLGYWARFLRLYERASKGKRLAFIEVIERHPTNPGHLHIHAAVTSYLHANTLRRLWYIALGGTGAERGAATPGGVHMRQFKSKEAGRRASRIARYIAKYMTKETLEEFNKKRYSCSRGASAGLEAESMWLAAKTRGEAMYELATLFGLDLRPENFWPAPSGRRIWAQMVAGDSGADPPPF